jgi:hypothetical protein
MSLDEINELRFTKLHNSLATVPRIKRKAAFAEWDNVLLRARVNSGELSKFGYRIVQSNVKVHMLFPEEVMYLVAHGELVLHIPNDNNVLDASCEKTEITMLKNVFSLLSPLVLPFEYLVRTHAAYHTLILYSNSH